MQKLQEEYAGKLNIRIGIELGLRTYLKDYYEELTKKYPFDFVIGSVHNVPYKKDAEGNILYTDIQFSCIFFLKFLHFQK